MVSDDFFRLHVLAPAPVGGLESVVETLATGQRERGLDVRVAAVVEPDDPSPRLVERLRAASVPLRPIEVPHRAYHTEVRALWKLFGSVRPAVVHTHGYRADVLAGTVARRRGLPTVSTVHGFTGGGWNNRLYERLQLVSLRRADAVVAVSRKLAEELREGGVEEGRLEVIPNAWHPSVEPLEREEARRELDLPAGAFVAGWVGRLSREKGADVLLEASARIGEEDLLFSVVGTGPQREQLERRAEELGIADRIRFHGLVPDAVRFYGAFDAFVLSSRTEGTPVVLFEAMEAAVPVVATRVGGVPDVVGPEHALLVQPEDPVALANALREIRARPDEARERAHRARRRLLEAFGRSRWLDRYEAVYLRVTAGRSADLAAPGARTRRSE